MQFGYFDDKRREYVITNPNTPASWTNYMGDTRYGAIITNNAGGYSFYRSAVQGRFMRFRPNSIPMDQPGRYIYLRDLESKDYWSASWQPVGKSLDEYSSVCRHGTAYTIIESTYSGIKSQTRYFVPLSKEHEYWQCRIQNLSKHTRRLRVFTYVEFSGHWNLHQDSGNLQYTQYTLKMNVDGNIIEQGVNANLPPNSRDISDGSTSKFSFIGIAGVPVTGFDTNREVFIGQYRGYGNPVVVEEGACTGSLVEGNNGCGVLQVDMVIDAGSTMEFTVVMGIGQIAESGRDAVQEASGKGVVDKQFDDLVAFWHSRLERFTVKSPDSLFNSMFNMWNPYNCLMTFSWSRAASLVYAGERDGYGYRDTVQDILGVIHILPNEAKARLELMITGQVSNGGAMPVVKFFGHEPGRMTPPDEKEYRSDDCMWLFNAIPAYVKETGDINFYTKELPYADKGSDMVIKHMRKAIEFTLERTGKHGLPCGLFADWNDCLELGHSGETVFVAFQLYYALNEYARACEILEMPEDNTWALNEGKILGDSLENHAWDGNWYLRAYSEAGKVFGSASSEEGAIWLNPQTWSILSQHASPARRQKLLEVVHEKLATEFGLVICDPPYVKEDVSIIKAVLFNPGMKENGGIFCHTQGWAVMAEALNGNGNRAFQYYKAFMPATCNDRAELREIEPYVYCQSTHGKASKHHGTSRLPWLTGAAAWAYYSAMHSILGIQPDYNGLIINPCLPGEWKEFSVKRVFRGKSLDIRLINKNNSSKGVSRIELNGKEIKGNNVPVTMLLEENRLLVYMC